MTSGPEIQPLCLRHAIGETIKERYTIRAVLGSGAFGTVYRVEEQLGQRTITLACKEMHVMDDPETNNPERELAVRMFQEEAYLLQTLRHPHIPAAFFDAAKGTWLACPQCGLSFRGVRNCPRHGSALQVIQERYYLLMDFIEGPDLEQELLAAGGRPLPEVQVLDWVLQVCDALQAVHAKGFSHRDIKPANIKLQQATRQAMLIDFGLVKPSTVAGGYGTVLQRKSTGAGTLGYAPPTTQEQTHPDARTDILALGMTIYRLLTARDPTDAADLEAMRKNHPRSFNPAISPALEMIIQRATKLQPAERYPDVASLQAELRSVRYPVEVRCPHCAQVQHRAEQPDADTRCERCGRPLGQASSRAGAASGRGRGGRGAAANPAPAVRTNPYDANIRRLQDDLAHPAAPPASQHDARIQEVQARLQALQSVTATSSLLCPGCRGEQLQAVQEKATGMCPLCRQGKLLRRQWELKHCPVCRSGPLEDLTLGEDRAMCPICRRAPLQEDSRRRFGGLAVDVWWSCPYCGTQLDQVRGNRASLVSFNEDPHGAGEANRQQTRTMDEWQRISGRQRQYSECGDCSASFDRLDEDRMVLIHHPIDPFGVGARYAGTPLSRAAWARIAQDLPATGGTHHCAHCAAEFDYERQQQTMILIQGPSNTPAWAVRWKGLPVAIQAWYLASAGKTSARPGFLCPKCRTEFDHDGQFLKLIAAPAGPLTAFIGQSQRLDDWQRRAQGFPTLQEATELRAELQRLQQARSEEEQGFRREQQRHLAGVEKELVDLLRRSVLEGYIPLLRLSGNSSLDDLRKSPGAMVPLQVATVHLPMRASELLRWESNANKCSVHSSQGKYLWFRDARGSLLVTSERVIFIATNERGTRPTWQRTLEKIKMVDLHNVQGSQVVSVEVEDLQRPVGFEIEAQDWEVIFQGKSYSLHLEPAAMVDLLRQLARI